LGVNVLFLFFLYLTNTSLFSFVDTCGHLSAVVLETRQEKNKKEQIKKVPITI
jgi:hypothetical protein